MSVDEVKVINISDNFLVQWDLISNGTIVAFTDSQFELLDSSVVKSVFDNDDAIGFVFSDIEVKENNLLFIEHVGSESLPNIPFFAKKLPLQLQQQALGVNFSYIMSQFMNKGARFEHVAEPCFRFNK